MGRAGFVIAPDFNYIPLRHPFEMGTVMRSALPQKQWLRVLATLALLVPIDAVAQSDPWVGRWGAGGCGPGETEIVLSRSSLDLSTFETVCSVRSLRQRADVFDLDATCQGEGARKKRATLSIQVRGNVLTFVGLRGIEFSPKRFERCGAQDSRGTEPPPAARASAAAAKPELPLQRGYYVADETPCGDASNGTLSLLRRNAMGVARQLCNFVAIESLGPARYRVVQNCGEGGTRTDIYEIRSPRSFRMIAPDGFRYGARYCAQSELPLPWKTNAIGDLIR